jgi:general secretion pathway protein G
MKKTFDCRKSSGFTLIELVIAITILTILTLGIIPLVKVTVKRQKEAQLREALREMREAIKEFHRDAVGNEAICSQAQVPGAGGNVPLQLIDPRSHVVISDCQLFNLDNPDHYPPKLETLVEGVKVKPRNSTPNAPNPTGTPLQGGSVDNLPKLGSNAIVDKKKVYLRAIPVDPMTGKAEWDLRSCYDAPDATSWGGENVFDVRSKSTDTALNGEKYSDW